MHTAAQILDVACCMRRAEEPIEVLNNSDSRKRKQQHGRAFPVQMHRRADVTSERRRVRSCARWYAASASWHRSPSHLPPTLPAALADSLHLLS